MKTINLILFCLFLVSCTNIEFILSEDKKVDNKLYNKTVYSFTGDNIDEMGENALRLFGKSDKNDFFLDINIDEEIIKRSVEKNQVSKKTDYEINIDYRLKIENSSCDLYLKNISSRFSFVTKSSGYNFGSDKSLSKLYDMSISENLNRFIQSANEYLKENNCYNES